MEEGTRIMCVGSANVEHTCQNPVIARGSLGILRDLMEKVDVEEIRFSMNGVDGYDTKVLLADGRRLAFRIPVGEFPPLVAGSSLNSAFAARALGHSVTAVVGLGGGNNGTFIHDTVVRQGIQCVKLPLGNTPTTVILRVEGSGGRESHIVYLCQKPPYPIVQKDMRRVTQVVAAREPDVICAFGIRSSEVALVMSLFERHPNVVRYFMPNVALLRSHRSRLRQLMRSADVFQCNAVEARVLLEQSTGRRLSTHDARQIAEKYGVQRVVVTCGSLGSVVYWEGKEIEVPAYPITPTKAIDPTGAGDVFAIGLIEGYFFRHLDPSKALDLASFAGAINCTARGGHGNVPDRAMIEDFLKSSNHLPVRHVGA